MSYKYTSISELIAELENIKKTHGDVPVATCGDYGWTTQVYADTQPYYYDGGYNIQDGMGPNGRPNFISSRKIDLKDSANKELGSVVKLKGYYLQEDDNFQGRPVREISPGEYIWLDEMEQKTRAIFGGELPLFKNTKRLSSAGHYLIEAYLENGLFAEGSSMNEAQENLAKKFVARNPNDLLKENI